MQIKRGDMFYADLSPVVGSEQGGVRPVLIIQTGKIKLPNHIEIDSSSCGLKSNSIVLAEQIRTIDKSRLKERIGHIDDEKIIDKVNNALGVSFGVEG